MASAERPTGTVTFLFTDIEGSTQRWDRFPAAMEEAVRRHDRIVREAVDAVGGHVFKTIGDAFCVAFSRAEDGVAAAAAVQRTLAAQDFTAVEGLRVRMALNTGTADERDGDYYGQTLNRVARLLSAGHGGQVLITLATEGAVRDRLPAGVSLRDMGEHRLKDLSKAEAVHQLLLEGLSGDFPALRTVGSMPNNLPAQVSSFVGRDVETAHIAELLEKNRLVTLLGPGGIGKTRISLEAGARALAAFSDGVWFVELAPVADGSAIAEAIASAVGLQESPGRSALDNVLGYLKSQALLLIFDNCEHVVADAAHVAEAILRACPKVKILASSRERLGIGGESVYAMPPLGVPPAESIRAIGAAEALTFGSVALFVERVQALDRNFALVDENAPTVADICMRLDGLALAIELAAARVRLLSLKGVSEKLDQRLRVLTGGSRTALPRQQTLRALIDWSFDLLSEKERAVFRRLAVFAGGFTLEAAGSVCASESIDEFEAYELVVSLSDKSLVHVETENEKPRYRLLESTREYAREKLADAGDLAAARRSHALAYTDLAERFEAESDAMPEPVWREQVKPEMENWRAALRWALDEREDVLVGQRLTAAMRATWAKLAPAEGRRWIARSLEGADARTSPRTIARLELADAHLAVLVMNYKVASESSTRALEQFSKISDEFGIAEAELFEGGSLIVLGDFTKGESLLTKALETFRSLGARRSIAAALQYLGLGKLNTGDLAGSRALFAEALVLSRDTPGAERTAAHVAMALAEVEFQSGDTTDALRLVREALATDRQLRHDNAVVFDLCNMAAYLVALDQFSEAAVSAREALSLAREREIEVGGVFALQHLAAVAALRLNATSQPSADARCAANLLGFVDRHFSDDGIQRGHTEQQEYDRILASLERSIGQGELGELTRQGSGWTLDQAAAAAASI